MFGIQKKFIAVAALAACLAANAQAAAEHEHGHHSHHGAESAQLSLNNGKKWTTDDNLRKGMAAIRDALAADLHAIHGNKETAEQYGALAKKVDEQIEFMVNNCKLDPDADAMLHRVLARIIDGSRAMTQQKTSKGRHQGAEKIAHALQDYPTYFEHPGWRGLE